MKFRLIVIFSVASIRRSFDRFHEQQQVKISSTTKIFSIETSSSRRSDQVAIIDDLAFAMYQDPEIAAIIRNLDRKKQECVHGRSSFPRSTHLFIRFSTKSRRKIRTSTQVQTGDSGVDQSRISERSFEHRRAAELFRLANVSRVTKWKNVKRSK